MKQNTHLRNMGGQREKPKMNGEQAICSSGNLSWVHCSLPGCCTSCISVGASAGTPGFAELEPCSAPAFGKWWEPAVVCGGFLSEGLAFPVHSTVILQNCEWKVAKTGTNRGQLGICPSESVRFLAMASSTRFTLGPIWFLSSRNSLNALFC